MSEFDLNIIDKNYYRFPVFPTSEGNNKGTESLFDKCFYMVTNINWGHIYNQRLIDGGLFIDKALNQEMLKYANSQLHGMQSIDNEVQFIMDSENSVSDKRRDQLRQWLIKYFENENKINFPKFGSVTTLRLAYLVLISILIKIFPEGIWCNSQEVKRLILDEKLIKLYLPSHKSHVDYMIIHLMCIRALEPVPLVIAGENLNVKFFGSVLAEVGAVYIKRNWFNYTDILMENYTNFFKFIISKGVSMELFIEGGRSRDGKLLPPKFGILKLIFDTVRQQGKPVVVLPLSIQYEKIYEFQSINNELIGLPKRKESMANILRHGYQNLLHRQNYGKVFLRFGEPIDLLQYPGDAVSLSMDVMASINDVSYITNVALFNTAIYLRYYSDKSDSVQINVVVHEVRQLLKLIGTAKIKSCLNLQQLSLMDDRELTCEIINTCKKFNGNCRIERGCIIVDKIMDLIIYKNNLIHMFINKSVVSQVLLHSTLSEFDSDLHELLRMYSSQFITFDKFDLDKELTELGVSLTKESIEKSRELLKWYSQFLSPFLESYVIFANLLASDKDALLQNVKGLKPNYMESKNKFYLVNFLKIMNDLKIYSQKQDLINQQELKKLILFLQKFQKRIASL